MIEKSDRVIECACGTGMISKYIAPRCKELIATDFSAGMLRQARRNCMAFPNVKIKKANIMELKCKAESFDKVVAGNVIHLLDEPYAALAELERVCKRGGKIIIPTYVNNENIGKPNIFVKIIEELGDLIEKLLFCYNGNGTRHFPLHQLVFDIGITCFFKELFICPIIKLAFKTCRENCIHEKQTIINGINNATCYGCGVRHGNK